MTKLLFVIDNIYLYENLSRFIQQGLDLQIKCDFRHSPDGSPLAMHKDFLAIDKSIDVKRDMEQIWNSYDIVFSIHCFQFFPKELVKNVLCINLHPGYNPINRGWFPQVFAIINERDTGATLHVMDEKLDNGPIIDRSREQVTFGDTSLDVYNRVIELELNLFKNNFERIIKRNFQTIEPKDKGYLYTKKDFQELNEIDLQRKGNFKEFYNLLRAQTHGEYNNAYVIDEKTGVKYFLKLSITRE